MSEIEDLRVVVFGAGVMGSHHVRVLGGEPGIQVVAVVDPDVSRAAALGATVGATGLASAPLDDPAALAGLADAAIVATPTPTHAPVAHALISAGIHTLVEKPIALTPDDGRALSAAAHANATLLMVGHVERFNPAVRYLADTEEQPLDLSIRRISPYPGRIRDSVVMDLMIHDIDLALTLMDGPPTAIHAAARSVDSDGLDIAHVILEFPHGVATLNASRSGQQKIREIAVTYPDRFVLADLIRQDVVVSRMAAVSFESTRGQALQQSGFIEVPFLSGRGESLANEHAAFFQAIRLGEPSPVPPEDGVMALELAGEIEMACLNAAIRQPA